MSLSKIIRKGGDPQKSYTLAPLGVELPPAEEDVFRPVSLGHQEEEAEPEEEAYLPPPCIPEEEALRRIQQAQADGMKEGKRQAEAALSTVSEALAQALLATGSLRARLMHESEEDLLKLSLAIARNVMQRELSLDPAVLTGMVQAAVELATEGGEVVVRLNPADYALVASRPEFAQVSGERRRVVLKEDQGVPSAGCLVETVRGNIDAGLDAQLNEISRRLFEEKSARRGENGAD